MSPAEGRVRAAFLSIAICLCNPAAWAQINTASVTGIVNDPTGASIPRASLVITETTTGLKVTSPADEAGQYAFRQLDPGEYSLTVSADGFKKLLLEHITLHAGDNVRQNYTLQVGEISQIIPVEAAMGLLETESAEIRDLIENPQVLAIPLKDHQFLELALLSEGVVNPPGGTRRFPAANRQADQYLRAAYRPQPLYGGWHQRHR
jgi:Carboxypeptidase regulatory-like domain